MNDNEIIFDNKIFKRYDDMYYVSEYGDVYSKYSNKLLKHAIDINGYHRVDIHGKHMKIHKLVYMTWVNYNIPPGSQINHIDDDKDNNHWSNLYLGTQKQNIADCVRNKHRVGHIYSITILDKSCNKLIQFPSNKEFIKYSGHNISNGSITHCIDKKWFKDRYVIMGGKSVETIEHYNSYIEKYNK